MYKLLIVDDEKMIRLGIKNGIPWEELGIEETFTAASAREALEIIETEHPQIMLTDISMTEMTGLDLIERIRNENADEDMRIIVLTGYDRFDYARQCLQMRVQNFLLKPIDEEELKANVKEQIEALEELRISQEMEGRKIRTEGARKQIALEKFLRDLVHQRTVYQQEGEYSQELREVQDHVMELAILIPDIYLEAGKETEKDFRQMMIKNICMDMVDARRAGFTFTDDDGKIMTAFCLSDSELDVTERIEELVEILEDEYDIKPRVVLGSEVAGLCMLHVSYNDAIHLLEQEKRGFREIVRTSREQSREQIVQDVYGEFKKAMITNIADAEQVMHIFAKFAQAMDTYNISRMQVQRWCFEIACDLYFAYIADTGETADGRIEPLMQTLASAGKDEALEVTSAFISKLVSRDEGNQHDIIRNARRYIDDHLEEELSVASLAEMFYISPNYFSRLFKKVMKEGCNEYIVKKRIEKSRILLETTTIKAGRVASMVGYNDTNYFSLAFKKHTGMSPTKYRETAQRKQDRNL